MKQREDLERRCQLAMNRLAKWRSVLTSWQLGTRPKGDPEGDAVSDHREVTLILRAEANSLTALLIKKGIISEAEWMEALIAEGALYERDLEQRFPGMRATQIGIQYSIQAAETMKDWRP